jgi:hypothetical protein
MRSVDGGSNTTERFIVFRLCCGWSYRFHIGFLYFCVYVKNQVRLVRFGALIMVTVDTVIYGIMSCGLVEM